MNNAFLFGVSEKDEKNVLRRPKYCEECIHRKDKQACVKCKIADVRFKGKK